MIQLDDKPVARAARKTPIAVDGGAHRVSAVAPGRRPWEARFEVRPSSDRHAVDVPVLPPVATSRSSSGFVAPSSARCPAGAAQNDARCVPNVSHLSRASYVVGAIGVGAVLVGAVTGVMALAARSAVRDALERDHCIPDRHYCPTSTAADETDALQDRARAYGWASTVGFGVGLVGVATASILPRDHEAVPAKTGSRPGFEAFAAPNGVGAAVRARF